MNVPDHLAWENPPPQVARRLRLVDELCGYLESLRPRDLAETLTGGVSTH
jgi:hypothetical protein